MLTVLMRRVVALLLTLLAVSVLVFAVMDVLPGDPAAVMLGTSASPDTLAALRHELGLDQPLLLRYFVWLASAARGDFGTSYVYGVPVSELLAERLAVTLPLAAIAVVLSVAIALPLGALSAARRSSAFDHAVGVLSQLFIAVPGFWVALLLILLFSVRLRVMPSGGFPGWESGLGAALKSLVLPAVALALPQAGVLTRVTRSAVLEVLNEDYVRTARAKGLPQRVALWRHAVPNAMVPVVTVLGLQFTFLVAGAILVENLFNLPGLGRLAYQALMQRDVVVLQDVVLFFAGLVVIVNFLVDLSYLFLDPRLRETAS
ncbi:ABC transporter permease [Ciceribacter thiooxidans]|uniref:ABC transporter permease n=1 Tax=Ciceribacter thiooxidans TaxID=1969821 RepID=A0ABV7HZZ4_9HYPH|nr:ABC transporter permease [Ciceribacter thiooxidans]MDI6836891.1 ABC transporter permease [Rhizobiaceae bacterium]